MSEMRTADRGVERRRDFRKIAATMGGLLAVLGVTVVVVALNGSGGGHPALTNASASPTSSVDAVAYSPGSTTPTALPSAPPASGTSASPASTLPSATTTAPGPTASVVAPDGQEDILGFDVADPISVDRLPFTYTANSRGAPSPPWDPAWECDDAEDSGQAVWFSYRAPEETYVGAWVSAAESYTELWAFEYDAADGSLQFIDCSVGPFDSALRFRAKRDTTYRVMVTDYEHQEWGGEGGEFTINFEVPPPLPEVSLSIDPVGTVLSDGSASFSGTISCSRPLDLEERVYVGLRQSDDVQSGEWYDLSCARGDSSWLVEVPPYSSSAPFTAGPAMATGTASVCVPDDYDFDGPVYCDEASFEGTVMLELIEREPPDWTPSPEIVAPPNDPPPTSAPPITPPPAASEQTTAPVAPALPTP